MALNSSSRIQLTQQSAEKSGSPLSKLKKVLSGPATSSEKPKKQKIPSMNSKKTVSGRSWSSYPEGRGVSSPLSPSPASLPAMVSDTRFPPLASRYTSPPTPIDWRYPLEAQASPTASPGKDSTQILSIAFPPAKQADISAPLSAEPVSAAPVSAAPVSYSPALSSPRFTESITSAPAPTPEKISSTIPDKLHEADEARQLFSTLEKNIERLFWRPSPATLQQLGNTMKQMNASGLDFSGIDASSLVLRILVNPGEADLDKLIAWIARLGCQIVSGVRRFGLERSSVLERAIERGWPLTTEAITERLRHGKVLRDHAENMLARAMQSDKPFSFLQKALQFSSDHCPIEAGITVKMVAILAKEWQLDPDNELHGSKFIALFNQVLEQGLNPLPVATLLQAATKYHHAPMALIMLQLNANTEYLDEEGKTVTDLALEAQQTLIEKIDALRATDNTGNPVRYQEKMDKYQRQLRSNQRILDALDAADSPGTTSSTPFSG